MFLASAKAASLGKNALAGLASALFTVPCTRGGRRLKSKFCFVVDLSLGEKLRRHIFEGSKTLKDGRHVWAFRGMRAAERV